MKNQFRFTALVLALGLASSVVAAESAAVVSSRPNVAAATTDVVKADVRTPRLSVGANRMEVLQKLGRPQFQATPEVWVYTGYHVENPAPGQEKFTHLIVRFDGRRVVRTELAEPAYTASLRQPATDPSRALALK